MANPFQPVSTSLESSKKNPSDTQNTFKGIFQQTKKSQKIFAKSTSCQACLPYERLFQGETDGSSFPNGGLRVTHSAAAFTTWDRASPPFVMDKRHGRWQWIRPGSGKMWESIRKLCHQNVEKCDYLHFDRNRYMIIICLDADIIWYDSCRV